MERGEAAMAGLDIGFCDEWRAVVGPRLLLLGPIRAGAAPISAALALRHGDPAWLRTNLEESWRGAERDAAAQLRSGVLSGGYPLGQFPDRCSPPRYGAD